MTIHAGRVRDEVDVRAEVGRRLRLLSPKSDVSDGKWVPIRQLRHLFYAFPAFPVLLALVPARRYSPRDRTEKSKSVRKSQKLRNRQENRKSEDGQEQAGRQAGTGGQRQERAQAETGPDQVHP